MRQQVPPLVCREQCRCLLGMGCCICAVLAILHGCMQHACAGPCRCLPVAPMQPDLGRTAPSTLHSFGNEQDCYLHAWGLPALSLLSRARNESGSMNYPFLESCRRGAANSSSGAGSSSGGPRNESTGATAGTLANSLAQSGSSDEMKPPPGAPEPLLMSFEVLSEQRFKSAAAPTQHGTLHEVSCTCPRCVERDIFWLWAVAGYTPSASVISPQDLAICKKPDGSDFLLGQGTFGAVRSHHLTISAQASCLRLHQPNRGQETYSSESCTSCAPSQSCPAPSIKLVSGALSSRGP